MLRKLTKVVIAGVLGLMAVALAEGQSARAEDKKLTTKEIMGTGHKGAGSLFEKIKASVKEKKWDAAAEPAKDLAANGSAFPKATPPKGDAKSWETLATKYADNTKALAEAVEKKDQAAANKAVGAIGGSCMSCHKLHRGK